MKETFKIEVSHLFQCNLKNKEKQMITEKKRLTEIET